MESRAEHETEAADDTGQHLEAHGKQELPRVGFLKEVTGIYEP